MMAPSNKGLMHTTFDLLLEAILRDKEMRMVGNWSIGKSISKIQVRGAHCCVDTIFHVLMA